MINEVFKEIYSAIIVKQYSPSSLGYFNRANSFVVLSSNNIASIVQRVSTPILCEAQNNHQQMGRVLIKFITNTALIVYPILFGLFVLAKPLISVLLTDKWLPSAWILQVLCPVGLFYIISTFNRNVFNATGRTDWALKSEVMKKIIYLPIIFTAIWFGFTALIFSQVIIAIIEFLLDTYYTKKQIGVSIYTQLKAISNIVLACIIMIIIIWISTLYITNNFAKLAVGFFVGSLTYITYCIVFNVADTRIIFNKLKNRTW
jgi:O-antigen/teichoic acid export membrane protein